ncbi:MAG: ATP-binding cassette domain-containing protein [Firmicutes bacterium]|nr:ATP-binding cassette domain-containing protein [Bacillota bacterium]
MNNPLMEVDKLRLDAGSQTILEVDRLALSEGQVMGVMGPNGAGKTSLLLVLASLIPPTSGTVRYRGEDLARMDLVRWRRRTAMVFQEPLLLDTTVRENVATGLKIRRVPPAEQKTRVSEWMDRLKIEHLARRSVRNLSGGEAQRVSLARALVLEPEILFLDEPFSALDRDTREKMLEELSAILRATRTTTVFVTHRQSEASFLADTIIHIEQGRIVGSQPNGSSGC